MKILIILFIMSIFSNVVYCDVMYNINVHILTTKQGVDKIVKKLLPNTTNYIWLQEQTFDYNNNTSSGTTYVNANVRLSDEDIRNDIVNQMLLDWDAYEIFIEPGSFLKEHTCYNNQGKNKCVDTTLRSK